MNANNTIMISGQTDLSRELFDKFYVPEIDKCVKLGHSFMMGTATGVDTMALEYVHDEVGLGPDRITMVYKKDLVARDDATTIGGNFKTYPDRDSFMTQNTCADVAFVTGTYRSIGSGTMSNLFRRKYGHEIANDLTAHLRQYTDVKSDDQTDCDRYSLYATICKFTCSEKYKDDNVVYPHEIYKIINDACMVPFGSDLYPAKN